MKKGKSVQQPIMVTQPDLPPLEEFQVYLKQIWESKRITNNGPFHQQLEKELCEYLGVNTYLTVCQRHLAWLLHCKPLKSGGGHYNSLQLCGNHPFIMVEQHQTCFCGC
jgi:dTDP-4-amino-4,6-dideoxygalactose transaminase